MSDNVRSRNWCFTWNNYCDDDCTMVQELECRYLIFGKEVGDSGTPHLQGYIVFDEAKSFKKLKKLLPLAHLEPAKGNHKQASDYCKKDNNYFEKGTIPTQGKRTDLERTREIIQETNSMAAVTEEVFNLQCIRTAEVYLKYHEKARNYKPMVEWYWGPTGTGKTRDAYEVLGEGCYFNSSRDGKWWEGYDAHKKVLIDDIRETFLKFEDLIKLLDRYPYRVETKGGSRQFLADHIIVTCPFHPADLFKGLREDVQQLIRRIDNIKEYEANETN